MPTQKQERGNGRGSTGSEGDTRERRAGTIERRVLQVAWEQGGIRRDQVGRVAGVAESEVDGLVERLTSCRWAMCKELVIGEEEWVWVRAAGARELGIEGDHGRRTKVHQLRHRWGINEVRIEVERQAPGVKWVSERVQRRTKRRGHIPDGVAIFNEGKPSEERHAIEVELSLKDEARWVPIIGDHSAKYEAVVYFCTPAVRRKLKSAMGETETPSLVIRNVPWREEETRLRHRKGPRCKPTAVEVEAVKVIAQQGGVPEDVLGALVGVTVEEGYELAKALDRNGFAWRREEVPGEPGWVWATWRGVRVSGCGLAPGRENVKVLEKLRVLSEVRAEVVGNGSGGRWISERMMRAGHRVRPAGIPMAVVEVGGKRHAIHVVLGGRSAGVLDRCVRWSREYDVVMCFCSERRRPVLKDVVKGLPNVVVRGIGKLDGRRPRARNRPRAAALKALGFVVEQKGASEEQLAKLMEIALEEARDLGRELELGELVKRHHGVLGGESVLWATHLGFEVSETGLRGYGGEPERAALERASLLNEARIRVASESGGAEWQCKRQVVNREGVPAGNRPNAVIAKDGTERVVEVVAGTRKRRGRVAENLRMWSGVYEGVVCVCRAEMVEWVQGIAADLRLDNVDVWGVAG